MLVCLFVWLYECLTTQKLRRRTIELLLETIKMEIILQYSNDLHPIPLGWNGKVYLLSYLRYTLACVRTLVNVCVCLWLFARVGEKELNELPKKPSVSKTFL